MFHDRTDAGRQLGRRLSELNKGGEAVVVVGLPRGGVPVAFEVARELSAPLDVILVRKLGVPFQPELGMGAIGENGVRVLNDEIVKAAQVNEGQIATIESRERNELERRARRYRAGRIRTPLSGRVVVVVDDGVATGSTAKAACEVARAEGAKRIILAVPVAPLDWANRLAGAADEFISLATPSDFVGVGQFFRDFTQTSDDAVIRCLDAAHEARSGRSAATTGEQIEVHTGHGPLRGHLNVPATPVALVVFAHGSGSSRHSPRNRYVASVLNDAGLATLLFDLLASNEEQDRSKVFDIEMLGQRLHEVTRVITTDSRFQDLPVMYLGASTGAGAALWAAAQLDSLAGAVVSRGGRPDLAGQYLQGVRAPTLLIVGANDPVVLELNRQAQSQLGCENQLVVVPGASHLFEEPGTLQAAAGLAREWFLSHTSTAARQ